MHRHYLRETLRDTPLAHRVFGAVNAGQGPAPDEPKTLMVPLDHSNHSDVRQLRLRYC